MSAPFRFRWSAGLLVTLMLSGFGVLWERQGRVEADLGRRNESQAALAAELAGIRRELERLREETRQAGEIFRREWAELRAALAAPVAPGAPGRPPEPIR